ncbi:MAG: hypothetical protein GY866_03400 [Proteobacteria bacterium]|nr:hypothetical protein [Pseudomonadota bacterium]
MEYAKNVSGWKDLVHEETAPDNQKPFIDKLSCSLVGETQRINIEPETLASRIYGENSSTEQFNCSYGLNEEYLDHVANWALKITGKDENGEARIVELPNHRFFVATLFLPQLSSSLEAPHPLIVEFVRTAGNVRE